MFKAVIQGALNFEPATLNASEPDRARPCKTAGILKYVLCPSRFPLPHRIFPRPRGRIPNSSARTCKQAAEKAKPSPYKCQADREPEFSSITDFATRQTPDLSSGNASDDPPKLLKRFFKFHTQDRASRVKDPIVFRRYLIQLCPAQTKRFP